jgi:hypothetical protein
MKEITDRVDLLEDAVTNLKKTTAQLKRDQTATRKHLEQLQIRVDSILPGVKESLNEQTDEIESHVSRALDEMQTTMYEKLIDMARQWPAAAIISVTAVLTLVVGVGVGYLIDILPK